MTSIPITRRDFVRTTGVVAIGTVALGGVPGSVSGTARPAPASTRLPFAASRGAGVVRRTSLVGGWRRTHGWLRMGGSHRVELTARGVELSDPFAMRTTVAAGDFLSGRGHDRVRRCFGDGVLREVLTEVRRQLV